MHFYTKITDLDKIVSKEKNGGMTSDHPTINIILH